MVFQDKIISNIKNNKKILIFGKGSNIEGAKFSGLNFSHYQNLDMFYNEEELVNFSNNDYDYFFIHGFKLRDFNFEIFIKYNIKIKIFCIDELGEGFNLYNTFNQTYNKVKFLGAKIKVLVPFNHYLDLESNFPDVDFFKFNFGGPRIFCSRYNRIMIHGTYRKDYLDGSKIKSTHLNDDIGRDNLNEVIFGLRWSDDPKSKIFMCLIGTARPHRVLVYNNLYKKDLVKYGYVTFTSSDAIYNFLFYNNEGNQKEIKCELPQLLIDENFFDCKFALHHKLSKDSYIDLVMESFDNELPFKTEKCVKPFYNLQFPIICGHTGIVNDLRNEGFDMFDDIIDHSYDLIKINSPAKNYITEAHLKKYEIIGNQIEKLINTDIHKIYIQNKQRLLYNQELLYKKTIEENKIFQELGKFIFGDDIEVLETDFENIEKIYL